MNEGETRVRMDKHGALRVGKSRVMLDSVVAAFERGQSAETIRQQYPALSLEEVNGAITYYLTHRAQVGAYLRRQREVWEHWRAKAEAASSPVVKRLRTRRSADVPATS